MTLPLTRQEVQALVVLGVTGLVGLTVCLVTRAAPSAPAAVHAPALNLNAASAAELEALRGIGPVTARRIVNDRREHGRFLSVEDLARVRGLSPKIVADLKNRLRVE